MRTLSNSILRSVCSLVIGVLLVVWPETAMIYLVITIGVLFFIPGLILLLDYFTHHRTEEVRQMFPIAALGSVLFGLWLMIMPVFFVSILMYILGFFLVLASTQLICNLVAVRRSYVDVPAGFFVIPVLMLLAGILVVFNPFETASVPFIILGVSCICYGLSYLINYYKFRKRNNYIQDVTPIEETPLIEDDNPDK